MLQTNYQHWLFETKDHIAYLTLNRPESKNRIGQVTLEELGVISEQIKNDPAIWAVVVQANGDGFSGGVDVNLIGQMVGQESEVYRKNLRLVQSFFDAFEAIPKPTIAALHGYVVGGGLILALCCDFRIGADNLSISLPEVKRSIGVIMGTQRITRTIGIAHTKELVMLGNAIDADRAYQMGLLTRLVPKDQLEETATQFARQFLKLPPLAVGVNKIITDQGAYLDRAGQDLEIEAQERLLKTRDFQEAISSFFEKRIPNFKGE